MKELSRTQNDCQFNFIVAHCNCSTVPQIYIFLIWKHFLLAILRRRKWLKMHQFYKLISELNCHFSSYSVFSMLIQESNGTMWVDFCLFPAPETNLMPSYSHHNINFSIILATSLRFNHMAYLSRVLSIIQFILPFVWYV